MGRKKKISAREKRGDQSFRDSNSVTKRIPLRFSYF